MAQGATDPAGSAAARRRRRTGVRTRHLQATTAIKAPFRGKTVSGRA
jgi:hypothetical protein